jgi:hypothetical protein
MEEHWIVLDEVILFKTDIMNLETVCVYENMLIVLWILFVEIFLVSGWDTF